MLNPSRKVYPSGIGPFSLLRESTINHWGKLAFRYVYWNLMLKGIELRCPANSVWRKENNIDL